MMGFFFVLLNKIYFIYGISRDLAASDSPKQSPIACRELEYLDVAVIAFVVSLGRTGCSGIQCAPRGAMLRSLTTCYLASSCGLRFEAAQAN